MAVPRAEYDAAWKHALEHYLQPFLELLFPAVHDVIDWREPPEVHDRELARLTRKAAEGRRHVDLLVKVRLKSGVDCWVLVHVEVQSQKQDGFAERMYVYNYRIFDGMQLPVLSLAVLADRDPQWRPERFVFELAGVELSFRFPVVKLVELKAEWQRLEASHNPIATAVMAHLKSQETRDDPAGRRWWKSFLYRRLHGLGYRRRDIILLYEFIDGVLKLPNALERKFEREIVQFERERHMPIVSTIERKGIEKGREEGRREAALRHLRHLLRFRFGDIPAELEAAFGELGRERAEELITVALQANSIASFTAHLSEPDGGQRRDR